MIEVEASIYDTSRALLDGSPIQMQSDDANVYSALLREARTRAANGQQVVEMHTHDHARGTSEAVRVHPDGAIEHPLNAAPTPRESTGPRHAAEPDPESEDWRLSIGADSNSALSFVREAEPVPETGFRRLVYNATGGSINLGLSSAEARQRAMVAAVQTRATNPEVIAVICLKGGIGKTSTTAGVGLTLAHYRGDRVIALDANPDAGDLYERTCLDEPPATLTDLAHRADEVQSMTDLSRFTGITNRLSVIAGDQEPTISESLSAEDFVTALGVVQHYYNVVMVDCGTGVTHPSMVGILGSARHIIIAGGYAVSGARRAEASLRWLHANGYEELALNATVVLTQTGSVSKVVDTAAIESTFKNLSANVITVPHDQAVADGTALNLEALHASTRTAYLEIAASIARNFQ